MQGFYPVARKSVFGIKTWCFDHAGNNLVRVFRLNDGDHVYCEGEGVLRYIRKFCNLHTINTI